MVMKAVRKKKEVVHFAIALISTGRQTVVKFQQEWCQLENMSWATLKLHRLYFFLAIIWLPFYNRLNIYWIKIKLRS